CRPGLPAETLARMGVAGEFRIKHLDGHVALQAGVERLEDDAHAAVADDLDNLEVSQAAEMRGVFGAFEKIEADLLGYSRLGVGVADLLHVALEGPEGSPVGG